MKISETIDVEVDAEKIGCLLAELGPQEQVSFFEGLAKGLAKKPNVALELNMNYIRDNIDCMAKALLKNLSTIWE